jgi:lathosterol oxidase
MLNNRPLDVPCRNINVWINSIFIPPSVAQAIAHTLNSLELTHYLFCYLRNFVGAVVAYYGTAGLFHYACYYSRAGKMAYANRQQPTASIMLQQVQLAQTSMVSFVLLPVVDEWLVEHNYTPLVYYTIAEIGGWLWYALYLVLYFSVVEVGIYWMHRTLHTNKTLYKHVHVIHHQYKTPHTLTPWASIAFHPLDGILQCCPYVLALLVVPCHYLTHYALLFGSAIWATYIHDAMDWNVWDTVIMGSKYHTVHHTHYVYNYGQVFTFCDRIWGTLREPVGPTGIKSSLSKEN